VTGSSGGWTRGSGRWVGRRSQRKAGQRFRALGGKTSAVHGVGLGGGRSAEPSVAGTERPSASRAPPSTRPAAPGGVNRRRGGKKRITVLGGAFPPPVGKSGSRLHLSTPDECGYPGAMPLLRKFRSCIHHNDARRHLLLAFVPHTPCHPLCNHDQNPGSTSQPGAAPDQRRPLLPRAPRPSHSVLPARPFPQGRPRAVNRRYPGTHEPHGLCRHCSCRICGCSSYHCGIIT
jgi:hypothetical protein